MGANTAACWMLMMVTIASVAGKPVNTMRTQKRQSDQRVAELETLLALQKYGAHHFLHSQSANGEGSFFPGYGIIDFNKIGRKKKSLPSPPSQDEEEGEVPNWIFPPSSSWASPSTNMNPSSDTIRISSRSSINNAWKAALENPITSVVETLDDETENDN